MKYIWLFLGLILLSIGVVVLSTGIYLLVTNQEPATTLANLHPDLWWGGLIIIIGLVFIISNAKRKTYS